MGHEFEISETKGIDLSSQDIVLLLITPYAPFGAMPIINNLSPAGCRRYDPAAWVHTTLCRCPGQAREGCPPT